jgi:hypothetical protein
MLRLTLSCFLALVISTQAQTLGINFPKAKATYVYGVTANPTASLCGYYIDQAGVQHGFTRTGKTWLTYDISGGTNTVLYAMTANSVAVGSYVDANGNRQGIGVGGLYSFPGAVETEVLGASQETPGAMSGRYVDTAGIEHGWLIPAYRAQAITLDVPGAVSTQAWGTIGTYTALEWMDSSGISHASMYNTLHKTFKSIDVPGCVQSFPHGMSKNTTVYYTCIDASGVMHGASMWKGSGGIYDVPGGYDTQLWAGAIGGCGACRHTAGVYIPNGKKMVRGFMF